MAVSEAVQNHLKGKTVCEIGCAEGDNMVFISRYANKVIGFEKMKQRYSVAQQRNLEIIVGDYFVNDLPEADVYYFWPDDGERDNEYLVQKILLKKDFKGTIIVGADSGFPPEVPALERCTQWGERTEVPYWEGAGHRENGTFLLAIIDAQKLKQQCTWLLSAPRSGSSCTTACFQLCGLSLGKNETQVKDDHNQKGYFENQKILTFNEKVLRAIGSNIFATADLTTEQESSSLHFKEELKHIVKQEYEGSKFFMIKDPRISILQKLYTQAFNELGIDVNVAIVKRKKENATASMNRMTGIPLNRAQNTYDHHYKLIDHLVLDNLYKFTTINFDDLLNNPNKVMETACKELKIPYGVGKHQHQKIDQFVEKRLLKFNA
jgi:hypothetical protein